MQWSDAATAPSPLPFPPQKNSLFVEAKYAFGPKLQKSITPSSWELQRFKLFSPMSAACSLKRGTMRCTVIFFDTVLGLIWRGVAIAVLAKGVIIAYAQGRNRKAWCHEERGCTPTSTKNETHKKYTYKLI